MSFALGDLPNLSASELKLYVRFIANKRLSEIGIDALFPDIKVHPIAWTDYLFGASIKANNFERTGIEYQRDNLSGSWETALQKRKLYVQESSADFVQT